jgi:YfiH family protein
MSFLKVEGWGDKGRVVYGFGTRDQTWGERPRPDWRGHPLTVGEETFTLLSTRQVHGDGVVVFKGEPRETEKIWIREGDALVTRVPGYALGVFTADCLPIILLDPVQGVAGIVHSGWRGTAKAICQKALKVMAETYDSISENILAAMGPCIGPCCYEVDGPVKEVYAEAGLPWELLSSPRGRKRWSLDLPRANAYLLKAAGMREDNIYRLELCTSCHRDSFYSYRAEGKTTGRQLNFIALKRRDEI